MPNHIYKVRDIVEMFQKHPQDAECVVIIGGTTHYITESGYRSLHRREVILTTEGEDRIGELEQELFDEKQRNLRTGALLEEFDKIISSGKIGNELVDAITKLHNIVTTHLKK